MKTKIIKVGNSKGVVIPGKMLRMLNLDVSDTVSILVNDGVLTITPAVDEEDPFAAISRGGWFEDTRDAHDISEELYSGRLNTREGVEL